jgi:hypothetical protein
MKNSSIAIILLIIFAALCGCISSPVVRESSSATIRNHYEYNDDWSVGLGCYSRLKGYVYNSGNTSADKVQLNFNLVNTKTGTIRDTKPVYIGTILPGESRTFETVLDGECTHDYRVELFVG